MEIKQINKNKILPLINEPTPNYYNKNNLRLLKKNIPNSCSICNKRLKNKIEKYGKCLISVGKEYYNIYGQPLFMKYQFTICQKCDKTYFGG